MVIVAFNKLMETLSWSKILAFVIVIEGFILALYDKPSMVAIVSTTVLPAASLVGLKTITAYKEKSKEEANG